MKKALAIVAAVSIMGLSFAADQKTAEVPTLVISKANNTGFNFLLGLKKLADLVRPLSRSQSTLWVKEGSGYKEITYQLYYSSIRLNLREAIREKPTNVAPRRSAEDLLKLLLLEQTLSQVHLETATIEAAAQPTTAAAASALPQLSATTKK